MKFNKKEYMKNWRQRNKNYYKKYYKDNRETMIENVKRYLHTDKGKATIARYEATPERQKNKLKNQARFRGSKLKKCCVCFENFILRINPKSSETRNMCPKCRRVLK